MKKLKIFLVSLLLCGCGDSNNVDIIAPGVDPAPVIRPLVLTRDNALRLVGVVSELTVPSGRHSVDIEGGNLTNIEIDGVAAALVELPLAFEILDQSPSRNFPGAAGGTAAVTVNGADVTIVFSKFITADRTTLDGTVFMSGQSHDTATDVLASFKTFQISDADGQFQIDGPVTLSIDRSQTAQGIDERVERTLGVTVTDLGNGGTAELLDFLSDSNLTTVNGVETGASELQGSLIFQNFQGLTGLVEEIPVVPFGFTVDEATEISTVLSGINLYKGDGAVRIRVIEPDTFEVSVRVAGTPEYEVVGVVDISDVDKDASQ